MADNTLRNVVRAALVVGVLMVGVVVFNVLKGMKQAPPKTPRDNPGALVETITVASSRQRVQVDASGTVVPARSVALSAEVGGRVTWMHPDLLPGGRLPKGATILKIDARDYRLAVEQQYAAVDRARTELEIEKSRKKIAEREWELLGNGSGAGTGAGTGAGAGADAGGSLALREPQLRTAEVALKAAESGLERARLAVGKTTLSLPFNAMVQARNVDSGQLVMPGTPLATLIGTDEFWVQVVVPVERLRWIDVPGLRGAKEGSPVVIRQRAGGASIEREGRVVRLMGDLDPAGRMARVLVAVDDPLGLGVATKPQEGSADDLPLLVGAYVEVSIDGEELAEVIEIPRDAVRDGDKVYVVQDDRLVIRTVDIVWRRPQTVLVERGLAAGDRVIVSPVPGAVDGMKVRAEATGSTATPTPAPAAPPADAPTATPPAPTGAAKVEAPR